MPTTQQQPLRAGRGNSPHDFTQSYSDWEGSIFDTAEYFYVLRFRAASRPRRPRDEFTSCRAAVAFARSHFDEGACVYAMSHTGRFFLLDREVWDLWIQREEESL